MKKIIKLASALLLLIFYFTSCTKMDLGPDFGNVGCFGCGMNFNTIFITNNKFSPDTLTVKKGEMITWWNMDAYNHDLTSSSDPTLKAGFQLSGEFKYTPQIVGTIKYQCTIHSESGIIKVLP